MPQVRLRDVQGGHCVRSGSPGGHPPKQGDVGHAGARGGELDPKPDEQLLDLFCGIGNFTLPLARRAAKAVGVEGDEALLDPPRSGALQVLDLLPPLRLPASRLQCPKSCT